MSELTNNSMAAKALSKLGASKGGAARAKSLSSDERSRIARAAVEKRWKGPGSCGVLLNVVFCGLRTRDLSRMSLGSMWIVMC